MKMNNWATLVQAVSLACLESESESHSVVSDSLKPHGLSVEFSRPEYWSG